MSLRETRVPLLRQHLKALRERDLIAQGADLEAVTPAHSSLSFGLAFVNQVSFRADCALLQRTAGHVAKAYAGDLSPRPDPGLSLGQGIGMPMFEAEKLRRRSARDPVDGLCNPL
jgi:hypothetical protein